MKFEPTSIKALILTWLVLILLHFTILGLSVMNLSGYGTVIMLILAVTQMALVMLVFMETRHSPKLVKVFALAGFFWLLIQFTLTGSDYLTRQFH